MFDRPCWKNQDLYFAIESATLQRIAWEFVRRNPDYQKAWAEYAERVRNMAAPDADVARYVELLLSDCASPEDWAALGDDAKTDALSGRLDEMGHYDLLPNNSHRFVPLDMHYGAPAVEFPER